VTSETPSKPKDAGELLSANPWMKHVDLDRHGYVLLDLDATRAQGSFFYVKDVESRNSQDAVFAKAVVTLTGTSHFQDAAAPAGDRPASPPLAPQPQEPAPATATATRTLPAKRSTARRHEPFGRLRR
jgi:alkaline phosphatase D